MLKPGLKPVLRIVIFRGSGPIDPESIRGPAVFAGVLLLYAGIGVTVVVV